MQTKRSALRLRLVKEKKTMRLLELFYNHAHYWGVPHPRSTDDRLIQTCYECGSEREVKAQLYQSNPAKAVAPYQGDKYAA